jgi:hypothetical protein
MIKSRAASIFHLLEFIMLKNIIFPLTVSIRIMAKNTGLMDYLHIAPIKEPDTIIW